MAAQNPLNRKFLLTILVVSCAVFLTVFSLTYLTFANIQIRPYFAYSLFTVTICVNVIAWYLTYRNFNQSKQQAQKFQILQSQYEKEIEHTYFLLIDNIHKLEKSIHARIKMEEREKMLNSKLVIAARRAGMTDVATSMLHNIGNVLNSLNVSMSFLKENINKDDIKNIIVVIKMLNENIDHLSEYILHDKKGKLIPEYLTALANKISDSYELIEKEISNMRNSVQHIKHIVSMQGIIGGTSSMIASISLSEAVELAIEMCGNALLSNTIQLEKEFQNLEIMTDRNKLLQILVNLLQNAKDAVCMYEQNPTKIIHVKIEQMPDAFVHISVHDNGIGIDVDQFIKLFSMGFTTKESGHGFGLHSSATLARELGGRLEVYSEGRYKGSTFILSLPNVLSPQNSPTIQENALSTK
jgi:C4-dicarboxylate-specific signal transduction histidine kinase